MRPWEKTAKRPEASQGAGSCQGPEEEGLVRKICERKLL